MQNFFSPFSKILQGIGGTRSGQPLDKGLLQSEYSKFDHYDYKKSVIDHYTKVYYHSEEVFHGLLNCIVNENQVGVI